MNRLALQNEDTAPLKTRYTVWARQGCMSMHHYLNTYTLAAAIRESQRMVPRGYITTRGERP